ncbi:MAG: hypothetical protein BM559_05920 [Roseobacter sp. MedPE-SWchi]|nr:MAG: hypothetical protein BM559_05920 [Roseobacter sp. MedPE-SWchi]
MKILQSCGVAVALIVATNSAAAEGQQSPAFDTEGYLEACSSRIPDVGFQIPMLQLCVSTAGKLCNMGREMQALGDCLAEVTFWLEQDTTRIETTYPEAFEQAAAPSVFADLLPQTTPQADCSTTQAAGLNATELCAYQTTLIKWYKRRVIERHQSNPNR